MSEQQIQWYPVTGRVLTDAQRDAVAEWQAHMAAQFMGPQWATAREALMTDGMTMADAIDVLLDEVVELLENGWDDYL